MSSNPPQSHKLTRLAGPSSSQESARPATEETPLGNLLNELRTVRRRPGGTMLASISSALEALWANRTRSLLTALGIFIGIAAVISALTLTQGATISVNDQIAKLGTNTITVVPGTISRRGVRQRRSNQTLTLADVEAVKRLPHVAGVTPFAGSFAQIVYGSENLSTSVQGVGAAYQQIQAWNTVKGQWFSDADEQSAKMVAVIGQTVVHELFDPSGDDPIGKTIRIGNGLYTVIGVLEAKGTTFGQDQDSVAFIPFHAALGRLVPANSVNSIRVQADGFDSVEEVQQAINAALETTHHIRKGDTPDFQTITSTEILKQAQSQTALLTFLIVGIAAISLTVGGIGIMNIMLVSVTERTREIGIRMSIGARKADIRNQFLIEAIVLCLIGGIVGLGLGLLGGRGLVSVFGMPFVITATTLIVPFAVSTAIGVLFGLYPAVRASRLDPIVALRRTK